MIFFHEPWWLSYRYCIYHKWSRHGFLELIVLIYIIQNWYIYIYSLIIVWWIAVPTNINIIEFVWQLRGTAIPSTGTWCNSSSGPTSDAAAYCRVNPKELQHLRPDFTFMISGYRWIAISLVNMMWKYVKHLHKIYENVVKFTGQC